ncbi:DUF3131 domain-containing protein [Klebsiella pneumoniae]
MRIRDALLSARSYLTILIGFLLGFAIVVWVEKQMPARVESSSGMTLSQDFPPLPAPRELTFDEAIWARVAWQYYVNNTQPNGLANAHDDEPWLSLWSVGSYLFAVVAAEQLHIVTAAEGDERIAAALFTLGQLPLNAQGLPAAQYHADTLQILGNPDSSAIGMGRLLTGLELGFDAQSAEIAWRIMQIQQRRHSLRVSKPPISTDYAEPAPDYASALADRQPQSAFAPRSATPEQTAITSTRTAFAWYALFRNSWSEALRQQVQTLQVPGKGWQRGLNLNRSVNDVVDGDTNAIVLESLAYISRGQMLCLACLSPAPLPSSSAGAKP